MADYEADYEAEAFDIDDEPWYEAEAPKGIDWSPDQLEAVDLIVNGTGNVFLMGVAGTGKSTVTHECVYQMRKRGLVVEKVAPSGVAAKLINGSTIHSAFGISPGRRHQKRLSPSRQSDLAMVDVWYIDEISMVRIDLLHDMDLRLKEATGNYDEPFGGKKIVAIGDFAQLPPVVVAKDGDTTYLASRYGPDAVDGYAFRHELWESFTHFRLRTNHRQSGDQQIFRKVLKAVRQNKVDANVINWMHTTMRMGPAPRDVVRLANTRKKVNELNLLLMPDTERHQYWAEKTGVYNSKMCDPPIANHIVLSVGCRVMNKVNDGELGVVNGSLGTIVKIVNDCVYVDFDGLGVIPIEQKTWTKVHPTEFKAGTDQPKILGTFKQMPLILAFALTMHASQGLSLPAIEIHVDGRMPVGGLYVALSRCTTIQNVWRGRSTWFREDMFVTNRETGK